MKNRYYTIVALLIVGHLLTELHSFIYWLDPKSQYYFVDDWFLKSGFKVKKLNILWYLKMTEDILLVGSILFAGACQAFSRDYKTYLEWQRYSFRLYVIWCIYFAYHIFDFLMLFYNYKTSYGLYLIALSLSTLSASFVGFYKKDRI